MEKIGKYDIVQQIGEGGFGVVYEGLDPFLKRRVAIKTCTSEAKELKERFFREAEIAGKLQHRHIVTVHDFGVHEEVPYLVQEFLSGHDLDQMIARRQYLPPVRKVEILLDVAKGLEHAHQKGVIHRDIKPGNIRVLDDSSAKILDFGIAKLANVASHLTRTGMTVGTAAYLPPEQIRGAKVDHRADIFSFGVTAHELLSGTRPYAGTTISKLFYQILNEPPPSVLDEWPDCPPKLADLVMRCLEKDPESRHPAFGAVIRELGRVHADMQRSREDFGRGATDVIPGINQGLTSLGQALVDEEDVSSGQHSVEEPVPTRLDQDPGTPGGQAESQVISWAGQLRSQGDPAAAAEALRLFLAETPGDGPAGALLEEIEGELANERAESLRGPIEALLAKGEFRQARRAVQEAETAGLSAEAARILTSLVDEGEASHRDEATRVAQEIETKVAEPRRLAEQGEFVRALRLIESLERHYGEATSLTELRNVVEGSRRLEEDRLASQIHGALSDGDIEAAEKQLVALRRVTLTSEAIDPLVSAIEEQRAVEKKVGDIVRRVESLIRDDHLDAAFAALKAAEAQHGSGPFVQLQQRVRKLRRAQLDRELARRIDEGRMHLAKGSLAETVSAIERALAIDPDNSDALEVLRAAQAKLRDVAEPAAKTEPPPPSSAPLVGEIAGNRATVRLSPEQIRAAERMAATAEMVAAGPETEATSIRPSPGAGGSTVSRPSDGAPLADSATTSVRPTAVIATEPSPRPKKAKAATRQSPPTRKVPKISEPPRAEDLASPPPKPLRRGAPSSSMVDPKDPRPRWVLPLIVVALSGLLLLVMILRALVAAGSAAAQLQANTPVLELSQVVPEPTVPENSTDDPIDPPSTEPDTSLSTDTDDNVESSVGEAAVSPLEELTDPSGSTADPVSDLTDSTPSDPLPTAAEGEPPSEESPSSDTPADTAPQSPPQTDEPPVDDTGSDPPTDSVESDPPVETVPTEESTSAAPPPSTNTSELLLAGETGVENAALLAPLDVSTEPSDGRDFALLYVLVTAEGTAERIVTLDGGTEDPVALEEARSLAASAQYQPASKDGTPGPQWTLVRVDF